MSYKSAINLPDCHIPWHDPKAFKIFMAIASDHAATVKCLNEINIMGDFLDFFWVSLHPIMPEMMSVKETFKDEVYQGIRLLECIRNEFPNVRINFIEGNHEYRLARYMCKKCPEIFEMITVPHLLQFERLKINYHPFGRGQLYQCLGTNYGLRHRPFNGGKHCASTSLHNKLTSLAFGDTHRRQSYVATDAFGNEVECHSLGWLGDKNATVFAYMDTDHWSQGFQIFHLFNEKKWFTENISIKDGFAVYNGNFYEG